MVSGAQSCCGVYRRSNRFRPFACGCAGGGSVLRGSMRSRLVRPRCRKEVMTHISIDEAKSRHEAELLSLPHVTGVGIGERDGTPVIKVFVTRKVPESQLAPGEVVPRSLEGHEVDVEEIGVVEAQQV